MLQTETESHATEGKGRARKEKLRKDTKNYSCLSTCRIVLKQGSKGVQREIIVRSPSNSF